MNTFRVDIDAVENFKGCAAAVFNLLVSYANNNFNIYPTRQKIAIQTGYNKNHIDKVLSILEETGAIQKKNRGYKRSNMYILNPLFFNPEIRYQLGRLFSSFRRWGMASLFKAQSWIKKKCVPINMYLYINNSLSIEKDTWSAMDDLRILQQGERNPKMVKKQGKIYTDVSIYQGKHPKELVIRASEQANINTSRIWEEIEQKRELAFKHARKQERENLLHRQRMEEARSSDLSIEEVRRRYAAMFA